MKKLLIFLLPVMLACSKGSDSVIEEKKEQRIEGVEAMSKKKDTINVIVYYANSTYNNNGKYSYPGDPIDAKEYDDKLFLITGQPWPAWWMVIKKWKRADYPTDIYKEWPPKK